MNTTLLSIYSSRSALALGSALRTRHNHALPYAATLMLVVSASLSTLAASSAADSVSALRLGAPRTTTTGYYSGSGLPVEIDRHGLLPLSLTVVDYDDDGFLDLAAGYATPAGGIVVLRRANRDAHAPSSPEAFRSIVEARDVPPFVATATVIQVPVRPDYILPVRLAGGTAKLIAAARGGTELWTLVPERPVNPATSTALPGRITAVVAGDFGGRDGWTDVAVGLETEDGATLLVLNGATDLKQFGVPLALPAPATSIAMAPPEGGGRATLAVVAGGDVLVSSGADVQPERLPLPFTARAVVAGEFAPESRGTELALLANDGTIRILAQDGAGSELPLSAGALGRGRPRPGATQRSVVASSWRVVETHAATSGAALPLVFPARLSAGEADDVVILEPGLREVRVLHRSTVRAAKGKTLEAAADTRREVYAVSAGGSPAAAIAMPLGFDARPGLVVLQAHGLETLIFPQQAAATFTVTRTDDVITGACTPTNCSLRDAIIAANATPDVDTIVVPAGTYTLTIAGRDENASASGDLDILAGVNIIGAGSANTIIQAGTTPSNGIDKVFSINPAFTTPMAVSMSGLTIQNGRNTSPATTPTGYGDGYGGALDVEFSNTGNLFLTDCVIKNNSAAYADGGGIMLSQSGPVGSCSPGAERACFKLTNSTVSDNLHPEVSGSNGLGGGVLIGAQIGFSIVNSTFSGNQVGGVSGQGGGVYIGSSDLGSIQGSTFSNNSAGSGGGLYSYYASVTLEKCVFINNSGSPGGAIRSESSTAQTGTLTVSYSRFAGNTGSSGSGISSAGKEVLAANNWWGCNEGPPTCHTVQFASGGSVSLSPRLQLSHTATPTALTIGEMSTLTAGFLRDSGGGTVDPANLSVLAGLPATFSGAVNGTLSGAQPAITAAGTATATFTASAAGTGHANATVDSSTVSSEDIAITGTPDLTIAKSHSGNFSQGQTGATYSITVTNSGNGPTTGLVTVTDALPAGLTLADLSGSGWTCTPATFSCIRSDALAAGASYPEMTVTVDVAADAAGSVSNSVSVAGGGESNTANNTATDLTTIIQVADLQITKAHVGAFTQGQTGAQYTIVVTNSGPGPTTGVVTVVDTLPTGLTATAMAGDGWSCTVGTRTCTRTDALPSGSSYPAITLTVNVANDAPASLTNSVTVSTGSELNASDNAANDLTTITQLPDLTIAKSHSGNFRQGQTGAQYTLTVTNVGATPTSGLVTVTDALPAALNATALGGTGWSCDLGTRTCTRGDSLAAGQQYPAITLTVAIANEAPASVTNTASVAGGGEAITTNNSASDVTTVIQAADLQISKAHGANFRQAQVGAQYTITVSNAGPGPTDGPVTVTDSLPSSLIATAMTGTGWSCALGTLTCTRSDVLANGSSYDAITLTVTVTNDAPASITNNVSVSGGGELNTANSTASDTAAVEQAADLQVAKSHTVDFTQGQTGATYTITVSNTGPGPTVGAVTVTDTLPAGLTATGWSGTGWNCVGLNCTRSDALASGGSYPPLTLTVNVAANAPASITNTVAVSGGGELNTTNNAAADPTTIIQVGDPAVTKTHIGHFTRGHQGTYTITVSNLGSGPTTGGVTVSDTLPAGLTPAAISGPGWTCTLIPSSCTRADSRGSGESYPPITLTVDVATDAGTLLMNTVTVSAVSDVNPGNNTATDATVILVVPTITWDTPAPITYGTALSATQLNAAGGVPGTFTYSPGLGTVLPAGPHTLNVTFTPDDPNTYAPVTASVNLIVSKATPVINWTDPAPMPYGTALSATQLNAATGVPGTFMYEPQAGTILTAGSHTLSVTFTPADTANYSVATKSVTQAVNKFTPIITWADPAPIAYGALLSATQLNASATVAGTFAYSPTPGTVLAVGSHTLNVTFTPTDTANINGATASVTLAVNKAMPVITWATPAPIAYGSALSATELDASASVPGTFEYTPAAGTVLTTGSHTLNVTFTPNDTANYGIATASVTQVVGKFTPVITWSTPTPIVYGTALSVAQLNASTTVAGTFAYSPMAGMVLAAGTQTLDVTFTPTDTMNYNSATGSVTLVVSQQAPVITWATPAAITYGTAVGSTQLNATANVAGAFSYSPAAGTVLAAGTHTLNVTFTPTDSINYSTTNMSVTLTVNQASPIVTWATPAAISYGTALGSPQLNAAANVAGTFVYSPAGGTILPAGSHSLSATFTPADSANYTKTTASVTQVVNKLTPAIAWSTPAPIAPGTALNASQLNATASIPGTFLYTPAGGTMLAAGIHTLNVTFTPADSANYNSASASVKLTVRENAQSIYFPPIADRWYRDAAVLLTATASSGLPVSYTVVSGPARISGSMLTITGLGRISVRASQAGGGAWEPAEDVEQSFVAGYRTEVRALPGLTVRIDDKAVIGASAFIWEPGTTHRIAVLPFQSIMPGRGYRFTNWSDGGAREHTINAAAADTVYTASFALQFLLVVDVQPDAAAGTVVPGTGFFDAGTKIALEARPSAGYRFVGYSGDAEASDVVMTEPRSVSARFTAGPRLEVVTNAASFQQGPLTSGGLFTAWGSGLGGNSLAITDGAGVERKATVVYASATQVNFITPAGLAHGPAVLRYTGEGGIQATLAVEVAAVVPALFSASMDGHGAPAGQVLRINAAGEQVFSGPLARCADGSGCQCEPIDLGAAPDQVFVILYGTGFRDHTSIHATIDGVDAEVTWAGAQPTYPGLDQINLRLPRALAGRGQVALKVTVDGRTSNELDLVVR